MIRNLISSKRKLIFSRKKLIFSKRKLIFSRRKLIFSRRKLIFSRRKLIFSRRKLIFSKRKFNYIWRKQTCKQYLYIVFNPLTPRRTQVSPFTEIKFHFKKGSSKRISNERRAYESVDEMSLSKVMRRQMTKKILSFKGLS